MALMGTYHVLITTKVLNHKYELGIKALRSRSSLHKIYNVACNVSASFVLKQGTYIGTLIA